MCVYIYVYIHLFTCVYVCVDYSYIFSKTTCHNTSNMIFINRIIVIVLSHDHMIGV